MNKFTNKAMYIYISGPYSVPDEPKGTKRAKVMKNIKTAENVALQISKKGHIPFLPHKMMDKWEQTKYLGRQTAMHLCHKWLEKCDALFYIGPSKGAESERILAIQLNLKIYRNIDDIPDVSPDLPSIISPEAREAYLIEYQECMQSYRHTYATIWQAGAIFTAISAAIVAFTKISSTTGASGVIPPWVQVLAPIPFLFWWWGVFTPMNRYGELRSDRLVKIEEQLSEPTTPGLHMQHFQKFDQERKEESTPKRVIKFKWLWRPRVKEVVTIFGTAVLVLEIWLFWKHYL